MLAESLLAAVVASEWTASDSLCVSQRNLFIRTRRCIAVRRHFFLRMRMLLLLLLLLLLLHCLSRRSDTSPTAMGECDGSDCTVESAR